MATRSVLISGTSTGIGAACTARLAGDDWRVYAGVRKEADGERLAAEIDGDVVPVILDVTSREQIGQAIARIDGEVGRLHGLVNNAGIGLGGPIEYAPDEPWRDTFEVNFFGLVTLTREAFPLVRRAGGRFVHIGSIASRIGTGGIGPYVASKHAVAGFNWTLRAELSRSPMTSSMVEPGAIATAIWDKGDDTLAELEQQLDGVEDASERYGFLLDGTRGFMVDGHQRGIDPDKVAAAVEHALTAKRPKARYLVGADAKGGGVVARLPDRLRETLIGLNARRMERMGRKQS